MQYFRHWLQIPLIISVVIIALGFYAYRQISTDIRQQTEGTLTAIAEQKKQQIESWIAGTHQDVTLYFSAYSQLSIQMEDWLAGGRHDARFLKRIQVRIDQLMKIRQWSAVTLFDTDAHPLFNAGEIDTASYRDKVSAILRQPHVEIIDLHLNPAGQMEYSLLTPIEAANGVTLGLPAFPGGPIRYSCPWSHSGPYPPRRLKVIWSRQRAMPCCS